MIQVEYRIAHEVWYAMKASYGKAIKAKEQLDVMHVESYVPMCYKEKLVKGRNKVVLAPAVPNLIFIKTDKSLLDKVKYNMQFLHNMLAKSNIDNVLEPIVVPDSDMERFIKVTSDANHKLRYIDMELNRAQLSKGTKVRVIGGDYKGYEGVLFRPKGSRSKRVIITICDLVNVELPVIDIELIQEI